ncbi:MAG: DNA recombination protein RmuC [Saprospiraceae bacterium]|nr:DNA recombination protein RmuC [Saprospiraceae bacterium]
MELLYLLIGVILGAILSALFFYNRPVGNSGLTVRDIDERFVSKELVTELNERLKNELSQNATHNLTIIELNKDLASLEQINVHIEEKLAGQKTELKDLQNRFQMEFENVANRLLEEKSQRFSLQNQQQIGDILNPLKERIREFEQSVERKFLDETRERSSLKTEIESLQKMNTQLSADANNLAAALRGNSKTQGDWGEMQLEKLLERAGLLRGVHYESQVSFGDENGQQRRPDFVIQLPDNKQLILDSKVSLTAYEQFFNAEDPSVKTRFLKQHIDSLRTHFRGLSDKNYAGLAEINTPDFVIMFVPLETAFGVAIQEDTALFNDALDRNVIIVTPTTLLTTMRTVSFLWKQENQKKHVLEIARQSGLLYDKFVAFIDDLKQIGAKLDSAQVAYSDAMNKLNDSRKFGDTLVGRAEKIRELGAKTSKLLPKDLTDE